MGRPEFAKRGPLYAFYDMSGELKKLEDRDARRCSSYG